MPEIEDLSGRKLGEFVLRARIAGGGFGAVYRCDQPLLGREAVVKVLHPRLRHNKVVLHRFLREAQLASRLDHPCAAHIYAFGIERDDGLFWIAMEMVQGVGLNHWLREHGPMALDRFVPLFEQLAEVVHAAHERGIVHRDLKPSNVMVIERAGRLSPKLLDFGVAKLLDDAGMSRTAPVMPGDEDAIALAVGADRVSRSPETVTQTASTPRAEVGDLRRLTRVGSMVGSPPYMSPEQWTNAAEVGPSSDLYALGVLAYEAITGRRPFNATNIAEYADLHCEAPAPPVGEGLPPALDQFFERALAKRPEQRWRTALELAAAFRAEWVAARTSGEGAGGRPASEVAPPGDDEAAPYLGLAPYAIGDAGRFVGREAEVAAFLERLRTRPLHVVVGPPGTGKSSFVHAGVIPGLPPGWRAVTLRPGAAPLAALAFRLEAAGVTGDDLRTLLATSPAEVAARVADAAGAGAIVVAIDQLEELFTLCASADEREQFAAAIIQLAASADLPVRVIATIRDDFLMQLDALPALRPVLSPALVLLGNPLRDDLVRIVVEPARRAGYTLSDPELAHDMVSAVASRPGALALLSFTARRLWELRDRALRQLTRSAYDAMGGIAGALVRHAEATFDALTTDEQRLAREIFRQLVTSDGARVPLTAEELHQRLAAPRSEAVLDKLIAARLIAITEADADVSSARVHVEVIHDALLETWPRLRRWIREDIDGVRMREQLRVAARQWSDRGRPRGLLWRDDVLVDLQRWLRQPKPTRLSELEAAFVDASLARQARGRRVIGLVVIGFVIVLSMFAYSRMQSAIERGAAKERLTEAYVDSGREALLDGRSAEALIYFDQAARRGDDSPKLNFMLARAAEPLRHELARLPSTRGRTWWAMFAPSGRWIVTADDGGARLWDARSMTLKFSLPHDDIVYQAAFTKDETQILTVSGDGVLRIWDATIGAPVRSLHHPSSNGDLQYFALSVSPDGTQAAAIDVTGAIVQVWDLRNGDLIKELVAEGEPRKLPSLEFSHDGHWLATSAGDDVRVYDTATWQRRLTIAGSEVSSLSFDPRSSRLAIAMMPGDVSIWAVPDGTREWHLREGGDRIHHVAYSPDGAFVVAAGADGTDRIWNMRSGQLEVELKNHHTASRWAEFDASSRLVVSTGTDGDVAIFDVVHQQKLSTLEGPRALVRVARFDPSSQRVIGASWDGTARIWDATASYLGWVTAPVGADCGSDVRAQPDRRFIAVACANHGTQIWDTGNAARARSLARLPSPTPASGELRSPEPAVDAAGDRAAIATGDIVTIYELPGNRPVAAIHHPGAVTTVAFAATGRDLVTGSVDGSLLLTPDGAEPRVIAHLPAAVDVAGLLPDGRVVVADIRPRLGVYGTTRRAPIFELEPESRIAALRPSSNGSRLITIPTTGAVHPVALWDLEQGQHIAQLEGHKGPVFSARFVRGDVEVLTAGTDGAARLWDAATGHLLKTYLRSSPYLIDAAIDPSGTIVVTAGGDGVLRFWDASSARMIWTLQAHSSAIAGVQFVGDDELVTRGFTGELAHWQLPKPPSSVDRIIRCLPSRFDSATGGLVDQGQHCESP